MNAETNSHAGRRRSRWLWALALLLALGSLAVVATPVWLIRPFAAQSPATLEVSYALRRAAPVAVPAAALALLALSVSLWRGSRWRGRALLVVLCALASAVGWFSWQNYFEWMFRPLPGPGYVDAASADFVAEPDMVLAVTTNGDAAAYPVRQIAYHHVVADTVGGEPVVVTY
jgi:hypothetical protein